MAGNDTVKKLLSEGRPQIGKSYRFWHEGYDFNEVQYMNPDLAPDDPWGFNCSSIFNWILGKKLGLTPIGGTGNYSDAIGYDGGTWEYFVLAKNYPPGTFMVTPFESDRNQGHVAVVSTREDASKNQYLIQSHCGDWISADWTWGTPGVTERDTMAGFASASYAGLLPGIPVIDGFPGGTASPEDIAAWSAEYCAWWELPRQLFVQASIPEVTTLWTSNRGGYGNIFDLPGMSYNVDYDSFGPVQQRHVYFPFPWNFETSLWTFCVRAWEEAPSTIPSEDDADRCAEWIANIQRPAAEYRGRYRRLDDGTDTHAWALELIGGSGRPSSTTITTSSSGVSSDEERDTEYWIGFTADREQWIRGVDVPDGVWVKPTEQGGKVWLELVPAGTTPAGTEYRTYGWTGFVPGRELRMRGVDVPRNAWVRPTKQSGKVWLELVPPA